MGGGGLAWESWWVARMGPALEWSHPAGAKAPEGIAGMGATPGAERTVDGSTECRPEQLRSSAVKILPRVLWAPCFAKGRNRQASAGILGAALPRSSISPGGAGRS